MDRSSSSLPASSKPSLSRRKTLLIGTAGIAAAGAVGVVYTDGGTEGVAEGDDEADETDHGRSAADLTMIAHRGFAGENPENTVVAAEAAAGVRGRSASDETTDRPADLIEIDVIPTSDGDVVVFHDDGLAERDGGARGLTDTEGVVWETDTATVTSAEVLDSGETVPRLSRMLEVVPADVGVNIELKNPGRTDLRFAEKLSGDELSERTAAWQPFVDRVVDTVDGHDNEFLFSSFYEGALAAVRELSSHAVAPVFWQSVEDGLAMAREHDAEAVHPPIELVGGTPFYDESADPAGADLVETAHAEGREVNVWTVETWYQADWLAAVGVDGLIANYRTVAD
jgi:glycerophosphoryl diester phosphodiesterase